MIDLDIALAAAAITVLLSTADITARFRELVRPIKVFDCPFCLSWWTSLALMATESLQYIWIRWPAIVCLANIGILLIHLAIATVANEEEDDNV